MTEKQQVSNLRVKEQNYQETDEQKKEQITLQLW